MCMWSHKCWWSQVLFRSVASSTACATSPTTPAVCSSRQSNPWAFQCIRLTLLRPLACIAHKQQKLPRSKSLKLPAASRQLVSSPSQLTERLVSWAEATNQPTVRCSHPAVNPSRHAASAPSSKAPTAPTAYSCTQTHIHVRVHSRDTCITPPVSGAQMQAVVRWVGGRSEHQPSQHAVLARSAFIHTPAFMCAWFARWKDTKPGPASRMRAEAARRPSTQC
mmetsp:Transcript_9109/g.22581  ORF Transcript_9109/g.22581 Transcript_9109/m.22581 type:complete len:222 (-) Transcript_9109:504-1169(-)